MKTAMKRTLDKLRNRYKEGRVVVKKINGKTYVYLDQSKWSKESQKPKTFSKYLGKITDDGTFIERKKSDLERAKAIAAEYGGKLVFTQGLEQENIVQEPMQLHANKNLDETDVKLLTLMSMNSRATLPFISKQLKLAESTVEYRIKKLEKELNIKYLLQLDLGKLGYAPYIILVKFEGKSPTLEELRQAIKDDYNVQFAATTKGKYDLVMYMIDEAMSSASNTLFNLRTKPSLREYKSKWNLIYFAETYPFMPLRDAFIEKVLVQKVVHKTKGVSMDKEALKYREFVLLKELNSNSKLNFTSIDKKYNLNVGTSRYAYYSLKEKGIIVRPTMHMQALPVNYIGVILITNIDEAKVQDNRHKFLSNIIKYGSIANRYSLIGNIGTPDGAIMFMPIYNESIESAAEKISNELQGSMTENLVITDVITGSLCYRRFDNDYSGQYERLVGLNKLKAPERNKYE